VAEKIGVESMADPLMQLCYLTFYISLLPGVDLGGTQIGSMETPFRQSLSSVQYNLNIVQTKWPTKISFGWSFSNLIGHFKT